MTCQVGKSRVTRTFQLGRSRYFRICQVGRSRGTLGPEIYKVRIILKFAFINNLKCCNLNII